MNRMLVGIFTVLLLAGCTKKPAEVTTNQPQGKPSSDTVFSTIKEAVTKSIVIECDYSDPEDGEQTKIYFKGPLVGIRPGANSQTPDMAGLLKDNNIYLWSPSKAEGFVIDLTKVETDSTISVAGKKVKSGDDVINALEAYRQNCKTTNETGVFELPTTVIFK